MADARTERSRRALIDATFRLLDQRALDDIIAADVASLAGVSRATFFRHFASREALFEEVAREEIDTLVAYTLPIYDAAEQLDAFRALCGYVDAHRTTWKTLLTGGAAGAMRREMLRASREAASRRAGNDDWIPVDLAVASTTSAIIEGLTWWLTQPSGAISIERAAEIVYRVVLEPTPPRDAR